VKEGYKLGTEAAFVEGILNESDAREVAKTLNPMSSQLNLATNGTTLDWTVKQT
jgi:hypothetical protein